MGAEVKLDGIKNGLLWGIVFHCFSLVFHWFYHVLSWVFRNSIPPALMFALSVQYLTCPSKTQPRGNEEWILGMMAKNTFATTNDGHV